MFTSCHKPGECVRMVTTEAYFSLGAKLSADAHVESVVSHHEMLLANSSQAVAMK
jgi:hypothetical protein